MQRPKPFDEDKDSNPFWRQGPYAYNDVGDVLLPRKKGLVTDFTYYLRGWEVPTLYCIWSTLFMVSSVIKRDAWLPWADSYFYPNLYVLLIGPAGLVKKSTAIFKGLPALKSFPNYLKDPIAREVKRLRIIKDKATPEAMLQTMATGRDRPVKLKNGATVQVPDTSETAVIVSELSTLANQQKYNVSIIETLTDLYDPHDEWSWETKTSGAYKLRSVYTTLLAATTPAGFRSSIPRQAAEDGFLSRCTTVYQPGTSRIFAIPQKTNDGPCEEDLSKRIAWIAENVKGPMSLSKNAFDVYEYWYRGFRKQLRGEPELGGIKSRIPIHVLKVAMLLHAQSFPETLEIDDLTVEDAIALVESTYHASPEILNATAVSKVRGRISKLVKFLQGRPEQKATRKKCLQNTVLKSVELDTIIIHLYNRGELEITLDGEYLTQATGKLHEEYRLIDGLSEQEKQRWEAED